MYYFRLIFLLFLLFSSCIPTYTYNPLKPRRTYPPLFNSIILEIAYIQGHEPNNASITDFENYLTEIQVTNNVFVYLNPINIEKNDSWSLKEIEDFEDNYRNIFDPNPNDSDLKLFISYLNNEYKDDRSIVGLQYGKTSFCMWERRFFTEEEELNTLLHEFGHVLGLVDELRYDELAYSELNAHCEDEKCIMYYSNKSLNKFCEDCLEEILLKGLQKRYNIIN